MILKGRGRLLRVEKACPPWAGLSCFQTNQRSSNQCPKRRLRPPVLRNSADIPWEETRLYLPADETEEENKALYERLKQEIVDGHPVDEYNNEVLCRLTPLQQKEVGIPAFYIRPVVPRLKSSDENEARLSEI